jgi:hypothetical protein
MTWRAASHPIDFKGQCAFLRTRAECPVEAIYPEDEVPEEMESYITKAARFDFSEAEPG